ncbi:MAG: PEP/pyruvate-binding domain-containing protein [Gammaproteobacteria bacterium]|jgi:hypothetical protein
MHFRATINGMQIMVFIRITLLLTVLGMSLPVLATSPETLREYRQWIAAMKTQPRGPFRELRWFCNDGTVLPPQAFACKEHGGGYQHGLWDERTRTLRQDGYRIASLLAGIDPEELLSRPDILDTYNQLLIEKFLITVDDGWIFRRAQYYRGAIQEEDEREGARRLLQALSAQPEWIGVRYPALRIGARMLSHGRDTASVLKVRQLSASLSEQDPAFDVLRGKIHGTPQASDARLVRDYAEGVEDPRLREKYLVLAAEIDHIYLDVALPERLRQEAVVFSRGPWLQELLREAARALDASPSAEAQYRITARLLADLRDALPRINQPAARLRVLDLGLAVESRNFGASSELRKLLPEATREQRIAWLSAAVDAAYGTGMINRRGRRQLELAVGELKGPVVALAVYQKALGYLARMPGWSTQTLRFQFYESMQKLAEIEPLAVRFIPDQLRGSPLLFYSQVLDTLLQDANRLAGVRHRLFGSDIGVGFRALNPGIARGTLHARPDLERLDEFEPHGIYLLPETLSDLPPVAGILTAGEGNPLSHVQLLARNLGIPNVGVDEALIDTIRRHDSEPVVLAVSPAGLIELATDGPRWDSVFGESDPGQAVVIRPDLEKLDLEVRDFIPLDDLRAEDSGRTVGPKAAKLGELRHHFPEAVAPGLAIPFGVFRAAVLEQPYGDSGMTVFEWMVDQYARMQALPEDSAQRREFTERFRNELYGLVANTRLDEPFSTRLRAAMAAVFGPGEDYGVFIRSDTNVEDLPGFTGAGLNLTLPNVVGFDQVLESIPRVWASPFTARAFAWRQSHMEHPEQVYPAVLLLESVANDKSGVMVTQDIDSGDPAVLSVAVNEGVGGAVDGQSAESLRIDTRDGSVRVLAMATAPWRRNPVPGGGIEKVPASGSDTVLQPDEIRQLITFARELPERFPAITDDAGNPAPADIEFGFRDGQLQLFQLRPFLESRQARSSAYLNRMDQALVDNLQRRVDLREVPQ